MKKFLTLYKMVNFGYQRAVINIESIYITPKLSRLLRKIDTFSGSWMALGLLAPERLSALRRVATIESAGASTRIEGSTLSDREVEKLLGQISIKSFTTRDEQEVAGYVETIEQIFESWESITLTENHICQLHRDLLRHSDKDERHRGHYKNFQNCVAAFDENGKKVATVFETATPFETPKLMADLVQWTNSALEKEEHHPILIIAIFIVRFLAIHPFQDGNGRLSRILTTLLMLRTGYTYVPYSSLENIIEHSKQGYYLALRRSQKTIYSDNPDWQPWFTYFLQSLEQQIQRLEKKLQREHLLKANLPELSRKIMEYAYERGSVSVAQLVEETGANRSTIKAHLRSLVASKHLELVGKGRGAWYNVKS